MGRRSYKGCPRFGHDVAALREGNRLVRAERNDTGGGKCRFSGLVGLAGVRGRRYRSQLGVSRWWGIGGVGRGWECGGWVGVGVRWGDGWKVLSGGGGVVVGELVGGGRGGSGACKRRPRYVTQPERPGSVT